jgi:hypothetical protein
MQVHGKGAKNGIAAVPGQAMDALQAYQDLRGVGSMQSAPHCHSVVSQHA